MTPLCVCAQVRLGECQLRICRDDWNSSAHHISVAAREDALLNTDQLLALDIRAAARTPARHWRGYVVPVTEVRVLGSGRTEQCVSDNAVHTFTSGSLALTEGDQGSYLLYRHRGLGQELQVFYRRCNLRQLCHCSVAVRARDLVITFDICSRGYMQVCFRAVNEISQYLEKLYLRNVPKCCCQL